MAFVQIAAIIYSTAKSTTLEPIQVRTRGDTLKDCLEAMESAATQYAEYFELERDSVKIEYISGRQNNARIQYQRQEIDRRHG